MFPRADMIRARALGVLLSVGLLFGAALLPGCFSSCSGKSAPPAAPVVPTPPSPMPAPAPVAQTPVTPAPGPAVQTPAAPLTLDTAEEAAAKAKVEEAPRPGLTLEGMRAIREGMSSTEVNEKIGAPGVLIAGTDKASTVYRWNAAGLSFLARFENGRLTRKSIITPEGDEVPAEKDERKTIDKDLYNGISPGMSFEDVMARIGIEAQPISKSNANVNIYTWRDANGSSFTARFEEGRLVRKTGLFVAKSKDQKEEEAKEGEAGSAQEHAAPEAAANAGQADAESAAKDGAGQAPDEGAAVETAETPPPGPRKGRVSVAGTTRRERDAENGKSDRSYRPKAQLPRNLHRLRDGSYEIRIHNTAESRVKAAVVSKEGTAEVTIPAGAMQSVFVNQGDYVVHFIYDDDPYTLHQGGVIPIGQWLTDMEVFLFGGAYNVQVLDHSTDRPPPRGDLPRR